MALSSGGEIGPQSLSAVPPAPPAEAQAPRPQEEMALWERRDAFEREQIEHALAATGGNQSEAARRLRISRSAFVDRLKKYAIKG